MASEINSFVFLFFCFFVFDFDFLMFDIHEIVDLNTRDCHSMFELPRSGGDFTGQN